MVAARWPVRCRTSRDHCRLQPLRHGIRTPIRPTSSRSTRSVGTVSSRSDRNSSSKEEFSVMDINRVIAATQHIDYDSVPWVQNRPGVRNRVLQARLDENIVVTQSLYEPGVSVALHRHLAPV